MVFGEVTRRVGIMALLRDPSLADLPLRFSATGTPDCEQFVQGFAICQYVWVPGHATDPGFPNES
jgi:hypothetical protein